MSTEPTTPPSRRRKTPPRDVTSSRPRNRLRRCNAVILGYPDGYTPSSPWPSHYITPSGNPLLCDSDGALPQSSVRNYPDTDITYKSSYSPESGDFEGEMATAGVFEERDDLEGVDKQPVGEGRIVTTRHSPHQNNERTRGQKVDCSFRRASSGLDRMEDADALSSDIPGLGQLERLLVSINLFYRYY